MALFSRSRPDDALPMLDVAGARRLRELVEQTLAALGVDATVGAQIASTPLGDLDLASAATQVSDLARRDWPHVVDEVVTRQVRSLLDGATLITDASMAEHGVVRILPPTERAGRSFRHARPLSLAGDLPAGEVVGQEVTVVVLAFDGDEGLGLLNDAAVADLDLEAAWSSGLAGLRRDLAATGVSTTLTDGVVEVTSPSWLTASWLLLGPEAVAHLAPELAGAPVVVAAPDHLHVVLGPADRAEAVSRLAGDHPVLPATPCP